MKSCTWMTEPPVGVGSQYQQHAEFLGRDINSVFEVVEYDPGSLIKATTISGTFPITFTRCVEVLGSASTRVQALIEGDSSGVFRLMEPLMRPIVRRSINGDYKRLKAHLEQ